MKRTQVRITPPAPVREVTPLGFLASLGPWGLINVIRRSRQFAAAASRVLGERVGAPWVLLPLGGYTAAKKLLNHFCNDSATLAADPDIGIYDTYLKYDRYPGKNFEWHVWKETLTERAEFFYGLPSVWSFFAFPRRKLNTLIDTLNRHCAFHRRVAAELLPQESAR